VAIEPVLQPLYDEAFHYNVQDEARLDVSAQGFGEIIIRRLFLMQGSSIPMLLVIEGQQFPHCIEILTSNVCMSSA